MPATHSLLRTCRQIHLYLGVFAAPALLFFAITGGLQTFSLHEATRGSSYAPPRWLAVTAQLHKKQNLTVPERKLRPPVEPAAQPAQAAAASPVDRPAPTPRRGTNPRHLLPLKIFVALVALALALSTLSGLYMSWRHTRHAGRLATIFAAGIAVPVVLILLQ